MLTAAVSADSTILSPQYSNLSSLPDYLGRNVDKIIIHTELTSVCLYFFPPVAKFLLSAVTSEELRIQSCTIFLIKQSCNFQLRVL